MTVGIEHVTEPPSVVMLEAMYSGFVTEHWTTAEVVNTIIDDI
jgi:hypothetical protein